MTQRQPPSIFDWGWVEDPAENKISIKWSDISANEQKITILDVTGTCKCRPKLGKAISCNNCSCGKLKRNCLKYCSCKNSCR